MRKAHEGPFTECLERSYGSNLEWEAVYASARPGPWLGAESQEFSRQAKLVCNEVYKFERESTPRSEYALDTLFALPGEKQYQAKK